MYRLILITVAVIVSLPSAAWRNVEREALDNAIEAFRSSSELMQCTEHNGQGIYEYYFKYTCKGDEITDLSFRPDVLIEIEKAFDDNSSTAQSRFIHHHTDGKSPLKMLVFTWPNSYKNSVSFLFDLNDSINYRFLTYSSPDTVRACYALVWNETRFNDHTGKPYRCFDGYIMTLTGNHWDYDTSFYKYYYNDERLRKSQRETSASKPEQFDYAILAAKIDELDKIFMEGKHANDFRVMYGSIYTMIKLLNGYNEKLTQTQGEQLGSVLQGWQKQVDNQTLSLQLMKAAGALADKIQFAKSNIVRVSRMSSSSSFFARNLQKDADLHVMNKVYNFRNDEMGEAYPWKLTGICPKGSKYVKVECTTFEHEENVRKVMNGSFSFTKRLQRGQFVEVTDDKEKETWWVINDSLPVCLNMIDGTVEGSDLNKRFLSYQRRIRNMAHNVYKYATCINGNTTIVDKEGFDSVVDSVRKIQYEAIADNKDNIIPAFYLPELCTEMPPQMLDTVMGHDYVWSDHVAAQPAWAFYEGQKKRLPGQMYHDVELQDTLGNTRRLSEYVGKGNYVLLHFWSTWENSSRKELKTIKRIVKDYKDKPLTVIGISLNNDGEDWRDYVRARNLNWTHLSNIKSFDSPIAEAYGVVSMPMTVLIAPDGKIVMQGVQHERLPEALHDITNSILK